MRKQQCRMVCGGEAAAVLRSGAFARPEDAWAFGSESATMRILAMTGNTVGASEWTLLCWPDWQCAIQRFGVSKSFAAICPTCSQSAGIAAIWIAAAAWSGAATRAGQA